MRVCGGSGGAMSDDEWVRLFWLLVRVTGVLLLMLSLLLTVGVPDAGKLEKK